MKGNKMCNGNCKCAKENHPSQGKPSSLTSIAFNTGVMLERGRIIKILTDRYKDLKACRKNDDCADLARIVKTCIDDIKDKDYSHE